MLVCDASHRMLRTSTALNLLKELYTRDKNTWQQNAVKALVGHVVLTRYNNKSYRVDDIDLSASGARGRGWSCCSPCSLFPLHFPLMPTRSRSFPINGRHFLWELQNKEQRCKFRKLYLPTAFRRFFEGPIWKRKHCPGPLIYSEIQIRFGNNLIFGIYYLEGSNHFYGI